MSRYSDLIDTQGVTHHWPLEETSGAYNDRIGTVHLNVAGAAQRGSLAVVNAGMNTSSGGYARATSTAQIVVNQAEPFSYSLIVALDVNAKTGNQGLIGKRLSSTVDRTFMCWINGTTKALCFDLGNNQTRWTTNYVITTEFQHIAFTYEPSVGYKLYVNGVLQDSTSTYVPTNANTVGEVTISTLPASTTNTVVGVIDEVAIFENKLLSPSEVAAQYATAFPITRIFNGTNWYDADKRVIS